MSIPVKYTVPKKLLVCEKGHLLRLRKHLVAIGYPLASNEETNRPDSVLTLREGYELVSVEDKPDSNHKSYFVARVTEQ